MLANLNRTGKRILLITALLMCGMDILIFLARCPLSPPIGYGGVLIGLGIQAIAFMATTSLLASYPGTSKKPNQNEYFGKAFLFCAGAFLVSLSIIHKSVLYSDTWGKGRGAKSIGDACCVLCV